MIPPLVVRNHENIDDIGADLLLLSYVVAGISSALTILVILGSFFNQNQKEIRVSLIWIRVYLQYFKINHLCLRMQLDPLLLSHQQSHQKGQQDRSNILSIPQSGYAPTDLIFCFWFHTESMWEFSTPCPPY